MIKDKIVLITGASSGIGAASASEFAKRGAKLLLCARRLDRVAQLARELKHQYAVDTYAFQLDVRHSVEVKTQIASLPTEWQSIAILVNNAGLAAGLDYLQEGNLDDWEAMLDTNVKGLLYVTRAILPTMIANDLGHIINIGSIAGHQVYPKGAVYCASKYAVKALTEGLRLDLAGTSIRVSTVDPGAVATEFSLVRFKGDKHKADAVYTGMQPLSASDIADAVVYCATRPAHVNISEMILMPTAQASATMISRK